MVPENTRKYAKNLQHEAILQRQNRLGYPTREVPVDVHINVGQNARTIPSNYNHHSHATNQQQIYSNHTSHIRVPSSGLPYLDNQPQYYMHHQQQHHHNHIDATPSIIHHQQQDKCYRCGQTNPCACIRTNDNIGVQSSVYISHPGENSHSVKNAVQLARNRKVESEFRPENFDNASQSNSNDLSTNGNEEHYIPDSYDLYRPLIIEVDCAGSTVLGITVEASQSLSSQRNCKSNSNGIDSNSQISTNHNITERVPRGLQVTNIQENSVIDRNGNFKIGDIIVEVNGVNLQRRSFQEAQDILRKFVLNNSSQNILLLRILRKSSNINTQFRPSTNLSSVNGKVQQPSSSPSPKTTPSKSVVSPSSSTSRHLTESFNTRKIGRKHRIELRKSKDSGFGINIAERDNALGTKRPIYIIAIKTTGSAYRDGRLKEGDMLLEINGIDLTDKTQADVTKMLRDVKVDELVEFVVSRQESTSEEGDSNDCEHPLEETGSANDCDNERSLIDFESPNRCDRALEEQEATAALERPKTLDGPGVYVYDIPINDTKSAGLGLYLKYPTMDRKDLGIYIEKVITGGAAWKDGRLQPDDQILAINGISLMGLSNADAADTLTAAVCKGIGPETTLSTIRLNIHRRMMPRSLTKVVDNSELERPQSARSWDEESVDARSGEERFQRDGFGRQSISEKKHAQLNAKNTDTYKRNQKLREERERQRLANLQLGQKHKETSRPKSFNLETYLKQQSTSISQTSQANDSRQLTNQIDQLRDDYNLNLRNSTLSYPTREVPVDVHVNPEQSTRALPSNNHNLHPTYQSQTYNHKTHIRVPSSGQSYPEQPQYWMVSEPAPAAAQPYRCWYCGHLGPCACVRVNNMGVQSSVYMSYPGQDSLVVKNAVRLARNRKVNASFRAAVDRSYG